MSCSCSAVGPGPPSSCSFIVTTGASSAMLLSTAQAAARSPLWLWPVAASFEELVGAFGRGEAVCTGPRSLFVLQRGVREQVVEARRPLFCEHPRSEPRSKGISVTVSGVGNAKGRRCTRSAFPFPFCRRARRRVKTGVGKSSASAKTFDSFSLGRQLALSLLRAKEMRKRACT